MANKNEVTISLEEYKELLLKERPNDNDKWILGKIREFIADNCKLNGEKIEAKDSWDFARDFLNYLKIIDKEFYKELIQKVYDAEIEKKNNELKMGKARAIKQLKEEENEAND